MRFMGHADTKPDSIDTQTLTALMKPDEAERVIASTTSKTTEEAGSTVRLEPEKLNYFSNKIDGLEINLIKSVTLC
jgi:hypothetical protein